MIQNLNLLLILLIKNKIKYFLKTNAKIKMNNLTKQIIWQQKSNF